MHGSSYEGPRISVYLEHLEGLGFFLLLSPSALELVLALLSWIQTRDSFCLGGCYDSLIFGPYEFVCGFKCALGVHLNQHVQKCQLSTFLRFTGKIDVFEYVADNFVRHTYKSKDLCTHAKVKM